MSGTRYPTSDQTQAPGRYWGGSPGLTRAQQRAEVTDWYGAMVECYEAMSAEDKAEVDRWDAEMVDGSGTYGTSDWPGWESRIGRHPCKKPNSPYEQLASALNVAPEILGMIADGQIGAFLAAEGPHGGMVMLSPLGLTHPPESRFTMADWREMERRAAQPSRPSRPTLPQQPPTQSPEPPIFTLYRLFDDTGRLLYVGITRSLKNRLKAHRRKWGDLIADVKTEEYDDLPSLMEAERAAIRDERPALNVDGIDEL